MRAGMQVGQAVLDRKLGQGGMAEVWLGHNAVLDTPVAVKFLIAPWAGHPDLEQRFLNEAKRQGALDHPNIVKAYGFEYVEDHSFLIMQYIDGESLEEKRSAAGASPSTSAISSVSRRERSQDWSTRTSTRWCIATSSRRTS